MPDKYGFEIDADRATVVEAQSGVDFTVLQRRMQALVRIEDTVKDILMHFKSAQSLPKIMQLWTLPDDETGWAISYPDAAPDTHYVRLRVLAGPDEGSESLALTLRGTAAGRPHNVERLGSVLHEKTGLPVCLLDPHSKDGLPPKRSWPV